LFNYYNELNKITFSIKLTNNNYKYLFINKIICTYIVEICLMIKKRKKCN
jgi:hypothetical protein